jgi:Tfp pilus assembly protein PilO
MKKAPNPIIIFGLAGFVMVAGLAGSYMQMSQRGVEEKKLQEIVAQLRDESAVDKELEGVEERLKKTKASLAHLEMGVPNTAYVPTLLRELEETGREQGMTITGVRPKQSSTVPPPAKNSGGEEGQKEKPKPYDEQLIEVKGTAEYGSVLGFLLALENFPKIVRLESIDVAPRSQTQMDNTFGGLEVTITLKAYLFSETKPVSTTEKAGGI